MPAFVNIGGIMFGGSSNQVGTYNGQNMQNAWDSHAPNMSAGGTMMGQGSVKLIQAAVVYNIMGIGQPIYDMDVKENLSGKVEGF